MEHKYATCNCGEDPCNICGGGLQFCTICHGAEGSLTTDCCGRPLTEEEERLIYEEGVLDYVAGEWVNKANYPRSPK